ncbi:MAG TPA: hypothetical protein VG268_16700, partial [Streptosporangiaceae bacterium]|nr:hypothetical protein [Streptosporangiaceae bacterium]
MITVLGAEVPDGSPLIPSMTGLARHWPAGHGNDGGIVPLDEGKHRRPERAVDVLSPQVVGSRRAGHLDDLVLDHVGAPEAVLQRGDLGGQVRIVALVGGQVLRGAEP